MQKREQINFITVKSVVEYLSCIDSIMRSKNQSKTLFFRGHASYNWELLPSIYRINNGHNESDIFHEVLSRCPGYFKDCKSNLEILTIMQHYFCPTRLLDITTNPLVALFFACQKDEVLQDDEQQNGEVIIFDINTKDIKTYDSDTAAMIAAFSTLKYTAQKKLYKALIMRKKETETCVYDDAVQGFNPQKQIASITDADYYNKDINPFIRAIKKENHSFDVNININDLIRMLVVMPQKNNPRIIAQDGCFILPGIADGVAQIRSNINKIRHNGIRLLIDKDNKKNILQGLSNYGFSMDKLFPEIDNIAKYIKEKYQDKIDHQ